MPLFSVGGGCAIPGTGAAAAMAASSVTLAILMVPPCASFRPGGPGARAEGYTAAHPGRKPRSSDGRRLARAGPASSPRAERPTPARERDRVLPRRPELAHAPATPLGQGQEALTRSGA